VPRKSPETKIPCPINLGDVFKVKTKEAAQEFLTKYHDWFVSERPDLQEKECLRICMANIGYFAGYGSAREMERVLALFNTTHPIFGCKAPSAEEAFNRGKKLGEAMKKKGG